MVDGNGSPLAFTSTAANSDELQEIEPLLDHVEKHIHDVLGKGVIPINDEHLPKLIALIRADKVLLEWIYPLFFEKKLEERNSLLDARSANPKLGKEMAGMRLIQQRLTNQLAKMKTDPDSNIILSIEKSLYKYIGILMTDASAQQELSKLIASDKKGNLYERINSGKAKIVWLPLSEEQPGTVYYTPTSLNKVEELQSELEVAKKIQKKLLVNSLLRAYHNATQKQVAKFPPATTNYRSQKLTVVLPPKGRHLQIDMYESDLRINESTLTIAAPQAIGDAEDFIRRTDFSLNQGILFAEQLIDAMVDLHNSKHVHGDLKPENLLVIGQPPYTLQLSDWGKTTKVPKSGNDPYYKGNPRFGCPEALQSQPGDVFSTGLILIRFLEEPLLKQKQEEMLIQPRQRKSASESVENLRGIEKFVVLNHHCPQSNSIFGRVKSHIYNYLEAENEIHRYIGALIYELFEKHSSLWLRQRIEQINYFRTLKIILRSMVRSDPAKRSTMQNIQETFNTIKDKLETL